MNIIDRIVSFFSPSAGADRARARFLETQYQRSYDAASGGRRTSDWRRPLSSANQELRTAGDKLRANSHELVRNNAFARRGLKALQVNISGIGIKPSIRYDGNKATEDRLKKAWKKWAESVRADYDELNTFYAIQQLCTRAMFEGGQVFIRRMVVKKANEANLQLQILESEFLDTQKDGSTIAENGNYIKAGIEFSAAGKRVAYWFFQQHPGETTPNYKTNSIRVAADEVIHLYEIDRPGQYVGAPFGSAAQLRLNDFGGYEDAQLIRQKIAACFAVFLESEYDDRPTVGASGTTDTGFDLERVEPGIIERLRPGQKATFAAPPPVENYAEYSTRMLQGVAAGMDVTYEALTGDYSQVNFSSGRMGRIEFGLFVASWQELIMIPRLCARVFEWWVELMHLAGVVENAENVTAEWTAPTLEFIDPMKEVKALVEKVRAGFISWQEAVRLLGYDPEVIFEQVQSDAKRFTGSGLMPSSDPRFDPTRQTAEKKPDIEKK